MIIWWKARNIRIKLLLLLLLLLLFNKKFRIKRNPNRPSLDYPLDLTKSTNHKIRTRKWTKNKENSKFRRHLKKHAIKTVFLWLVNFDHLSGPLRKQKFTSAGSKGHCLRFMIGGFRSRFVSFCVSRFLLTKTRR